MVERDFEDILDNGAAEITLHARVDIDLEVVSRYSTLKKHGVTVDGVANCFIIAPDNFSETLKSSYTLEEVNTLGLVCLPAAGERTIFGINYYNSGYGYYWTSSPQLGEPTRAAQLLVFPFETANTGDGSRGRGRTIRLVN